MTRIVLELDAHTGLVKLHHDAGQTVQVDLRWADGSTGGKAVASNVLTAVGQVRYNLHDRQYILGSES